MASKPCLPVSRRRKVRDDAPVEFDDISSMDATEYLSRVMQQSQRLPEIMHRSSPSEQQQQQKKQNSNNIKTSSKHKDHVPIEGSAASLSYLISDRTAIQPPPSAAHLPVQHCAEWVDQTLANFSQLRLFLEKARQQQQHQQQNRQPVPAMKDRPGWHIFCLGEKEAHGNTGSYFADDDDGDAKGVANENNDNTEGIKGKEGNPNIAAAMQGQDSGGVKEGSTTVTNTEETAREPWQENLPENGVYPSTRMMLQLDQVMIRKVIAHLAHYAQEGWHPCSVQRTLWLYALLARLEKPIHRNDAAVLYGLLKALTRARATLTSLVQDDREGLARLNVLITIVGIYFEQGGGYAGVMEVK